MNDHLDRWAATLRAVRLVSPADTVDGAPPHVAGDLAAAETSRDADEAVSEDGLDQAERAVLVALADGQSAAEIAAALGVPEEMLGITMANVLAKLHRQHAALPGEHAGSTGERVRAAVVRPNASG